MDIQRACVNIMGKTILLRATDITKQKDKGDGIHKTLWLLL